MVNKLLGQTDDFEFNEKSITIQKTLENIFPGTTFDVTIFGKEYLEYEEGSDGDSVIVVDGNVSFYFGFFDGVLHESVVDSKSDEVATLDENLNKIYQELVKIGFNKISFYEG